jgi:hypothetical protein
MLSLWQKTSGTWINVFTILLGTTIGLSLRGRMAAGMQQILTQGLVSPWLGPCEMQRLELWTVRF